MTPASDNVRWTALLLLMIIRTSPLCDGGAAHGTAGASGPKDGGCARGAEMPVDSGVDSRRLLADWMADSRETRMAEYRLYCFGESGTSYKAALMLALCGCDWEPRLVDYFNGETRGDAYRRTLNELGEAPVLEHRGQRLTQSGVILTYLSERTGRFGGRSEDA